MTTNQVLPPAHPAAEVAGFDEAVMTPSEAAVEINISPADLLLLLEIGKLPTHHDGTRLRLRRADVLAYMREIDVTPSQTPGMGY